MAYCSNCGTQIEESAKFCPKCGNSIRENLVNVNQPGSLLNNSDEMSKSQKSGAGCATTIALACIMGGLSEGNAFIVIVSLAATGAMIYLFMGKIDKKYTWATIIAAILGVFVVVGATHKETPSTEKVKSEQKEESETNSQAREQKEKEDVKSNTLSAFAGDYTYSYYLENTNAKLYFRLSLKADGTFTFGPVNESTKGMMDVQKVVDGYDYPEGGKWEVKETSVGKAAFLEFDCNWGEGSITPDKSIIQIKNMNGYNLKAPLIINN